MAEKNPQNTDEKTLTNNSFPKKCPPNITKTKQQTCTAATTQQCMIFREKSFLSRPALLDTYFDLNAGQFITVYNFIVALFILAVMGTWAQDFNKHGNPFYHLWLIRWNFAQLPQTMSLWTAMYCSTIAIPYYGLKFFANFHMRWSQTIFITIHICYIFGLFYLSIRALFWLQLKGACAFIITVENTRLAMKSHSFVRENFSKANQFVLKKFSPAEESKESDCKLNNIWQIPSIKQFIYFTFCPSLIYRDSYPRNSTRNWRRVIEHLLGCFSSIYFVNICFTQYIIPLFNGLAYPEDISWRFLFSTIFPSTIPGGICLFLGIFYGLLHSWLSMFAEALQFADRHFYSNWWSSRNMAEYYRNWNLVVHEWLYAYVYRDISMILPGRYGSILAQCSVFFVSSLFHEYWFGISLRMFYPAIFTLYFIFGGVFFLVSRLIKKPYIWNIIMWWNLLFGTGIFIVCYGPEWYARQKCARFYESDLMDIIVPRIWVCHRTL